MHLKTISCLFICFICCTFSYSQEIKEILVVSDSWPGVTNKDGTGLHFELLRAAYESAGITMKYQIVPYARSIAMVMDKKADLWIASGLGEVPEAHYPKWHHHHSQISVAYKKGGEYRGAESFDKKKVCWVRGYDFHKAWGIDATKFELVECNTPPQGLQMMMAGRVDYFVDVSNQISDDMTALKVNQSDFEVKPAFKQKLYFGFAKTDRGKKLATIWDDYIEKNRTSEQVKAIFERNKEEFAY